MASQNPKLLDANQSKPDASKKIYVSKLSEDTIHKENGYTKLSLKMRVDSIHDRPIVYVTCLSDTVNSISPEDAIIKAKELWQNDGEWNAGILIYKEAHPANIVIPDDLESVIIPADFDKAIEWIKMVICATKKRKNFDVLNYFSMELLKTINFFLDSGYIIEDPNEYKFCLFDYFYEILQVLMDKPETFHDTFPRISKKKTEISIIDIRTREKDFGQRFRERVFMPAVQATRESFTKDGIIRKIIITDINIDIGIILSGNKTDVDITDRLLPYVINIGQIPLFVIFTNRRGDLSHKTILGKDKAGRIYARNMRYYPDP